MMRTLPRVLAILIAASLLASCSAEVAPRRKAAPRPAPTASTPPTPTAPPDVLADAPVGPDGIPVPVQRAVDAFAGRPVKLKPGPAGPEGGPRKLITFLDAKDGSEYTFDGLGELRMFVDRPRAMVPVKPGQDPRTDDELLSLARDWVRTRLGDRPAGWPAEVQRRVAGTDQKGRKVYEIKVELRERLGGVPTPNYVSLNIGASGEPDLMSRDDGPVDVPSTTPKVSKDRAVEMVAAEAGYDGEPKVKTTQLLIERDPVGVTRLVWRIELDPPPPPPDVTVLGGHVGASVDAMTGAVLQLMR